MSKAVDHRQVATLVGFILLAFCFSAKANTDVTFWESPVNGKLNSIEVSKIAQDGSGAIWFATQEGLTRQRGENVDIFTAANLEQGGLKPGRIEDLAVSSAGHLWVLTRSLQVFNSKTQSFDTPVTLSSELKPISLAFDSQDRLWMGLEGAIALYRPGLGEPEIFDLPQTTVLKLGSKVRPTSIVALLPFGDAMLGINSEAAYQFQIADDGRIQIKELATLSSADSPVIVSTADIHNNSIFIGTISSGLLVTDLNDKSVIRIQEGSDNDDLPSNLITSVLSSENGVWLGTQNGLVFTENHGRSFQYYGDTFTGLPSNWIVGLSQSSDGSYWVGTRAGLAQGARTQFDAFNATNSNLSHNHVNAVHQTGDGTIWVGTQDGLNELKPGENSFRWINSSSEPILSGNQIMSLSSQDEVLWIGTFDAGLYRLDIQSRQMTEVALDSESPFALQAPGVTAITPHSSGDVVASTFGGGIAIVDSLGGVKRVLRSPPGEYLNDYPITMAEDENGVIFVGLFCVSLSEFKLMGPFGNLLI